MKRRISAATRRDAILICDVGALNAWSPLMEENRRWIMRRDFGVVVSQQAARLSWLAWSEVRWRLPYDRAPREVDAEAAALLRSGWSPGDAVEVRE